MATLDVWLPAGTIIPSDTTTGLTAGTTTQDGYCQLSGSDAQLKVDYKAVTGYELPSIPQSNATVIGSGSLFGGGHDGMR